MMLAMARRTLAWLLVPPIAAAGVLAAHAVAYALTGTDPGPEHEYLGHAPQVVGLLASLALLGLALQERSLRPRSTRWFTPVAPIAFVCQEHLERLAHTGEFPGSSPPSPSSSGSRSRCRLRSPPSPSSDG